MTLPELNSYSKEQFVKAIGWVFEKSPWVAERAWRHHPFASFNDLSMRLIQEVQAAAPDEQLALLCAYPDFGMPESLSAGSAEKLLRLTGEYRKKFGFPFLFATRGSEQADMLEALKRRLKSTPEQEFVVALGHVFRIARFRLEDSLQEDTLQ